jgi:hypothetical protein
MVIIGLLEFEYNYCYPYTKKNSRETAAATCLEMIAIII